ncbi:sensor domain-containing phosphodiesterase [Neptunicella marina]|uniref:EAL domain-containing protein n=1 Tax=Neptunicella marina TaxID=2125989 RepID=A0A8J6IV70_9ALTE|nr:EAL domain-containing protein [Neptunicella marina]MBC3766502.1 EAL domain-containing protein [Neptunicella marina]
MAEDSQANELSVAELRELVPQLQQLTDKYKRAELIQKALFDISELASSVNELTRLYPAVHQIIAGFMTARNFFVAFHNSATETVDFAYFVDEFDELTLPTIPASELKKSLTAYILRTGNHLFLTKENTDEQLEGIDAENLGADPVDWIGVPLKRDDQVIGAMVVQSYDESERYTTQDLEVLLFVSQHIVNALDRVKNREITEQTIVERTQQLQAINEDLEEEINERQKVEALQQALFEISELSATAGGEITTFYSSLHDVLARLISAPNCYIATINKDTQFLEFPYFSDEVESEIKPRPMGRGLTEYVLRTGQAALIDKSKVQDLAEAGELAKSIPENMLKSSNSWLGSPLVVEGEIYGVIAVQTYSEESPYTFKDLELLKFVSHHIAVAMERKRAAESIQKYNQQLAEKVKERTTELNQTNETLKKQIEERKKIELKLIHDAHHDALTGLPNRVMFSNRLELAVANKQRHKEQNFAVLFIDLDRFKQINDTIGHYAGDMFLIEVAKRIGSCIRGHDLLARLGGDEFVILLDTFETVQDAEDVASRIIDSLSKVFVLNDKEMYSGASIGIAILESWYKSADEVIRDADAAMYQSKSMGRGQYALFNKSMRDKLLEELELENEFRRTLRESAFECFFQPVLNLETKESIYFEAYIRWEHPKLGKIQREQFSQVAEESGLTLELDNFLVEQACTLLRQWQYSDGPEKRYRIAINISVDQILQPRLINNLLDKIRKSGINPYSLIFEFDENTLNRRSQHILPTLTKLKKAGIQLVLDNFGSGLASLSYLYSYPLDYVKIDHRYVRSIPRSQKNLKMIQSILNIGEHLDFKVIAEGIETAQQYRELAGIGCQFGQGSYVQSAKKLVVKSDKVQSES